MNNNVITLVRYYNILSTSLSKSELIRFYGEPNVEQAEKIISENRKKVLTT